MTTNTTKRDGRPKGAHCHRGKRVAGYVDSNFRIKQAINFPPDMHAAIARKAEQANESFSAHVVSILARASIEQDQNRGREMSDMEQLADKLSKAARTYLLALSPNTEPSYPQFARYAFAKPMKGHGLGTAWALIRKGIVKVSPEPVECGQHYASLTDLGLALRDYLKGQQDG